MFLIWGRPQIQQKLNEAKSKANPKTSDDETMSDGGFLEKVLSENSSISENEVISSVTELIYGAIDQVTYSSQFNDQPHLFIIALNIYFNLFSLERNNSFS